MPNYFAHITFGTGVLEKLSPDLQKQVGTERAAFELGCLGPDILFFYHPATRNPIRTEGLQMHHRSALPAMLRLRRGIEAGVPMGLGYAIGFLCHLTLDSVCHPYIEKQAKQGGMTHLGMEAEFDRMLIVRRGLPWQGKGYMPERASREVYRAAALAYVEASAIHVERGHMAMCRDVRWMAQFSGTEKGNLAERVCAHVKPLRGVQGVILREQPALGSDESNQMLLSLFEKSKDLAAEQAERYNRAILTDDDLDIWLDRNFYGDPCGSREMMKKAKPNLAI